ncbi:hypothetical protein G7Y79_00042g078360 [Physcia stellaris]|nr:hypothetical protein G7Y79_00042g078360 [Physcia stellaris]
MSKPHRTAEAVSAVSAVSSSDPCTSPWLSRPLWTQRTYKQATEATYTADRWEEEEQWVDRFGAKLRGNGG